MEVRVTLSRALRFSTAFHYHNIGCTDELSCMESDVTAIAAANVLQFRFLHNGVDTP